MCCLQATSIFKVHFHKNRWFFRTFRFLKVKCKKFLRQSDVDLWISDGMQQFAVELKYKTKLASIDWMEERFDLANHGAPDLGGYDVWKDVQRLERICAARGDTEGYVVFLTNDPVYWNAPASDDTIGSAFRLYEGREASGGLFWASHAGDGSMKSRENPIRLRGRYRVAWNDYARLGIASGLTVRFAVIPVATLMGAAEEHADDELPRLRKERNGASKYHPLHDYLRKLTVERIELTFGEIEKILGFSLPKSARKYTAFWANDKSHVCATQWMGAGWRAENLNLADERIKLVRQGETVR